MIKRLTLLGVVLSVTLASCSKQSQTSTSVSSGQRPNVLVILVDDMGYGDLPLYGNKDIETPNLDKMAAEGLTFTQYYANSPICSPSRTAILTGQYPLRWNITSYLADSNRNINRGMAHWLDQKAPSLGRIFQQAGYHTAHVGKWHMGGQRNVHGAPMISEYGFNTSLTSFEGLGDRHGWIFDTKKWNGSNKYVLSVEQEKLGHGNFTWIKRYDETQVYVDRAMAEMEKAQRNNQPFYVNLWPSDVHLPVEAPPGLRGDGSVEANYNGVIVNLDKQLGRLFDYIRSNENLRNNTIIVFTSDNGPAKAIGSSGGLRGNKGFVYEGGIREPFIVWAPGSMNPSMVGKVNENTVVVGMDLAPSLLAIAGVPAPTAVQFDGLNLQDVLLGKSTAKRQEPVMWVRPPEAGRKTAETKDLAIREGKWKLLMDIDGENAELYDIETNPTETQDLAKQHPALTAQLKTKLMNWFQNTRPASLTSIQPWKQTNTSSN
ncbi:MAG: sulfatase-like hydrolase/transferase [Rufibacter sp.]